MVKSLLLERNNFSAQKGAKYMEYSPGTLPWKVK